MKQQTHQNIVAGRLRRLANEMTRTADDMRELRVLATEQRHADEIGRHARELDGAAKLARQWARRIKGQA
jgi:hypothetical protein